MIDDNADFGSILDSTAEEQTTAKFRPKLRARPRKAPSKASGTNGDNNHEKGSNNLALQGPRGQESMAVLDTPAPPCSSNGQDVDAAVGVDSLQELISPSTDEVETTARFQPKIRREKGESKIISVLPNSIGAAVPTDSNSEHCSTEEQPSHDREDAGEENQCHYDVEPVNNVVEERPRSDIAKEGSSMNLRSRKKAQIVGMRECSIDDNLDDGDYIGPSVDDLDDNNSDQYVGGGNQKKVQKKLKEKNSSEEPSRRRKRTSKDSSINEPPQELHKDESKASSRGRKRASEDKGQPEKKLSHRIRQKRKQELKSLLEMPEDEVDRKKLSMKVLRLYQEAREHTQVNQGKGQAAEPSASNQSFRSTGYENEWETGGDYDYEDEGTNITIQNETKLNYSSYMNKSTQIRWSKSDTDLFYQAIRQFGTDFAMVQQLFPNRTRRQVSLKFKSEEKKHPMQIHDALIHRSTDNSYFRRVIEQLNIQDVQLKTSTTHDVGTESKGEASQNESALGDYANEEEDDLSWSSKIKSPDTADIKQGEQSSAADTDDLAGVFDWY